MTPQKNTFNGILNVYKEQGYTSTRCRCKTPRDFKTEKIGHTGTLDPAAEGVLPVCLGKATKVCELLTDKDKTYQAVLHLGVVTDTQDMTGEILEQKDAAVSEAEVREAILGFVGEYAQVPPMYSALKVNGKKLCDLAREGKTVERKARKIKILEITIDQIALPLSPLDRYLFQREHISARFAMTSEKSLAAADAWNHFSAPVSAVLH